MRFELGLSVRLGLRPERATQRKRGSAPKYFRPLRREASVGDAAGENQQSGPPFANFSRQGERGNVARVTAGAGRQPQ